VQLNRLVETGSIEGGLHMRGDRHPVLEADDGALIDSEQIARLLTERAVAQVAGKAMRQSEVPPGQRQPHRRGQIHDNEVGFSRSQHGVVITIVVDEWRGWFSGVRVWRRLRDG
jgi:hypothetical protein